MLGKIKDFFNNSAALEGVQKGKGAEKRLQIAACALMIEMAKTDNEFSEEEEERILIILRKEFALSNEMCDELIELANEELKASLDLWQFTNLINSNYSVDEKIRLMEIIWKVVYADGKLDKHEDYLAKKLATLLNLRHREMIDAKLRVLGKK